LFCVNSFICQIGEIKDRTVKVDDTGACFFYRRDRTAFDSRIRLLHQSLINWPIHLILLWHINGLLLCLSLIVIIHFLFTSGKYFFMSYPLHTFLKIAAIRFSQFAKNFGIFFWTFLLKLFSRKNGKKKPLVDKIY